MRKSLVYYKWHMDKLYQQHAGKLARCNHKQWTESAVSKKQIPDIIDCKFEMDYQILIIPGANIPDTIGHQTIWVSWKICYSFKDVELSPCGGLSSLCGCRTFFPGHIPPDFSPLDVSPPDIYPSRFCNTRTFPHSTGGEMSEGKTSGVKTSRGGWKCPRALCVTFHRDISAWRLCSTTDISSAL